MHVASWLLAASPQNLFTNHLAIMKDQDHDDA
jgi:hypothetical protein